MGNHDQPDLGPIEQEDYFCLECRQMFYFWVPESKRLIEEHQNLHRRLREYVSPR